MQVRCVRTNSTHGSLPTTHAAPDAPNSIERRLRPQIRITARVVPSSAIPTVPPRNPRHPDPRPRSTGHSDRGLLRSLVWALMICTNIVVSPRIGDRTSKLLHRCTFGRSPDARCTSVRALERAARASSLSRSRHCGKSSIATWQPSATAPSKPIRWQLPRRGNGIHSGRCSP